MSTPAVRPIPITDPTCPCCLTPTLGADGQVDKSYGQFDDGTDGPPMWWKARCGTCRTEVERHLIGWLPADEYEPERWTITEEVAETTHGRTVRDLREAKAKIEELLRLLAHAKIGVR